MSRDVSGPPAPFVLSTHLGTLVCVDEVTGELVHRFAERDSINLVFIVFEGRACVYEGLSAGVSGLARHGRAYQSWDIQEDQGTGATTISSRRLFACAEPSGAVTMSRPRVSEWEMFRRLSLPEAYGINYAKVVELRRGQSIPKTIHQTYMHRELPEELSRNVTSLQNTNPDFEYKLWVDEEIDDFIHETYGLAILRSYRKINREYGACRADLFRYLCIYKFGGVYLDIKSCTSGRLTDILLSGDEYVLSHWDNSADGVMPGYGLHRELPHVPDGEYEQWHVMATAGHPFLERVVNRVLRNIETYDPVTFGVGKNGGLRLTGPIAYTNAISEIIARYPHRFISSRNSGLIYNNVKRYTDMFVTHYTTLNSPLVR